MYTKTSAPLPATPLAHHTTHTLSLCVHMDCHVSTAQCLCQPLSEHCSGIRAQVLKLHSHLLTCCDLTDPESSQVSHSASMKFMRVKNRNLEEIPWLLKQKYRLQIPSPFFICYNCWFFWKVCVCVCIYVCLYTCMYVCFDSIFSSFIHIFCYIFAFLFSKLLL